MDLVVEPWPKYLSGLAACALTLYSVHRCVTKDFHYFGDEKYFVVPSSLRISMADHPDEIIPFLSLLVKDLKKRKKCVVGLDLEWKPTHGSNKNPALALLQISTKYQCLLVRLCNMKHIPDALIEFLNDSSILKAGVAISNDVKLLYEQYGVITKGAVDVQHFVHKYDRETKTNGLAGLAESVLSIQLNKSHKIRCGNWEATILSRDQIEYAALDAWVGCEILESLYEQHNLNNQPILEWAATGVDITFKHSYTVKSPKNINSNGTNINAINEANKLQERITRLPARKSDLYQNILMQDPSGEILCGISKKKADWYLERNIAELIETESQIYIRLFKEPKGRGHAGDEYYTSKKENKCVVCGKDNHVCRFSIVPQAYRRLMPMNIKSHSSHDIVLLCQFCLRNATMAYDRFKHTLSKEMRVMYQAPQIEIDVELQLVAKAALSLSKYAQYYNDEKKAPLIKKIKKHFNLSEEEELSQELIDQAAAIEYRKKLNNETHEEAVVKTLTTELEQQNFVIRWRTVFMTSMQPKFMPTGWKIEHKVIIKD
jgi:hypothetical protein